MILGFPFVSTGVRKRKGGYTWKRMDRCSDRRKDRGYFVVYIYTPIFAVSWLSVREGAEDNERELPHSKRHGLAIEVVFCCFNSWRFV